MVAALQNKRPRPGCPRELQSCRRNPPYSGDAAASGFAGALTLPPAAVTALGLPYFTRSDANLADGSLISAAVHRATIVWDVAELDVAVLAIGQRPLLGTALLDGFNLNADFTDGGDNPILKLCVDAALNGTPCSGKLEVKLPPA